MTNLTPIECEARLVGLSKQRRKDGDWTEVRFHIHPDDTPHALFILPLGTDCNLSIKGPEDTTEIADDETPKPARPKGTEGWSTAKRNVVKEAGRLCNDPLFQTYLFTHWRSRWEDALQLSNSPEETAAQFVRRYCGVNSRRDLEPGPRTAFRILADGFYDSQQGRTDEDLREQARSGP